MSASKASAHCGPDEVTNLDKSPGAEIHSYLVQQAASLEIDISGDSIQSTILNHLLQEILDLEKQRTNPDPQHEPQLPDKFGNPGFKSSLVSTNVNSLGLEFYIDSPQSNFYSRLMTIRSKLYYEIHTLRTLERTTTDPVQKKIVFKSKSFESLSTESISSKSESSNGDHHPEPFRSRDSKGIEGANGAGHAKDKSGDNSDYSKTPEIVIGGKEHVKIDGNNSSEGEEVSEDECWLLADVDLSVYDLPGAERRGIKRHRGFYNAKIVGPNGSFPISLAPNQDDVLEKYPRILFTIERNFYHNTFFGQTINIISGSLGRFMDSYKPDLNPVSSTFGWDIDLILFHRRREIEKGAETQDLQTQLQVRHLLDATREDHEDATALFARSLVTLPYLKKLFFCHTILVTSSDPVEAFRCGIQPVEFDYIRGTLTVEVHYWLYDGRFHLTNRTLSIRAAQHPVEIKSLKAYPLQFASSEVQNIVTERGKTFWMVRQRSFVSYTGVDQSQWSQVPSNYRYMIDYGTYSALHPNADEFTDKSFNEAGPMSEEDMKKDEPPGNGLQLIFPPKISGFSIQDKKWRSLLVDYIKPVTWNKVAFDRLVLKSDAKELIQAVVQVHNGKERSADLIQGKGSGSIILLHGPPGTGKSLTAESVADLVQRPLYRVTCGDIGTDPESVEKYLESVLYIGKIWGCVLLLDEADVFLEERTLTDLHRNALVSELLRVLEYYDGIIILTSNRVGTFDEAFKSRINLALHYTSLKYADRRKVWRNLFKTLKETDPENVDFEDLEDNLDELAKVELNGRDIRNAISVARELARFRKGEKMNFGHLSHVISIGEEFEKYLDKTHGHTRDEWLKENGIRS